MFSWLTHYSICAHDSKGVFDLKDLITRFENNYRQSRINIPFVLRRRFKVSKPDNLPRSHCTVCCPERRYLILAALLNVILP